MARTISPNFYKWLRSKEGTKLLQIISQYPVLSIGLAENELKVYFQGRFILSIDDTIVKNEDSKPKPLDEKHYANKDEHRLEKIINSRITRDNLQKYLDTAIAFLSRSKNPQENRIRQEIAFVNNRSSVANDTDYFIVDQEYQIYDNGPKFDLVAIKWLSKPETRKKFTHDNIEIVVFELKHGYKSVNASSGDLKSHIDDFNSLKADEEKFNVFKEDILTMFAQQALLDGFFNPEIKGLKNVGEFETDSQKVISKIKDISKIKVRFGFIISDYKQESSALARQLNLIEEDYIFVKSSFTGYGLYENSIITKAQIEQELLCE